MKEKLTISVSALLLVFAGLFIYSCKTNTIATAVPDNLLHAAKKWRSQKMKSDSTKTVLRPMWKSATINELKDGRTQIIVPTQQLPSSPESAVGTVRKFVFDHDNGKIMGGRIVEIYADKGYVADHKNDLLERYENGTLNDFTGSVLVYDVRYHFLGSFVHKDGTMQPARSRIVQVESSLPITTSSKGALKNPTEQALLMRFTSGPINPELSLQEVIKVNDKEIVCSYLVMDPSNVQNLMKLNVDASRKRFGVNEKTSVWIITPKPSARIISLSEYYKFRKLKSKFEALPLMIDGKFVADTAHVFIDVSFVEKFKAKSDSIRLLSKAYAAQWK